MNLDDYYNNMYENFKYIQQEGELICPFCYKEIIDAIEYNLLNKDYEVIECDHCAGKFHASAEVEVIYKTVRQDDVEVGDE
jgi:hypothetical protein